MVLLIKHTANFLITEMRCFTASGWSTASGAPLRRPKHPEHLSSALFTALSSSTIAAASSSPVINGHNGHTAFASATCSGGGARAARIAVAAGARSRAGGVGGGRRELFPAGRAPLRSDPRVASPSNSSSSNDPSRHNGALHKAGGRGGYPQRGIDPAPGRPARGSSDGCGSGGPGRKAGPSPAQQRQQLEGSRGAAALAPSQGSKRTGYPPTPAKALTELVASPAAAAAAAVAGEAAVGPMGRVAGAAFIDGAAQAGRSLAPHSTSPPPPLDPVLGVLLRAVRPLDEAGFAYCAVRRTAAWLHGVDLPLRRHSRSREDLLAGSIRARNSTTGICSATSSDSCSTSSSIRDLSQGPSIAGMPEITHEWVQSQQEEPWGGQQQQLMQLSSQRHDASTAARSEGGREDARRAAGAEAEAVERMVSEPVELEVEVQWDQMKTIHELFGRLGPVVCGAAATAATAEGAASTTAAVAAAAAAAEPSGPGPGPGPGPGSGPGPGPGSGCGCGCGSWHTGPLRELPGGTAHFSVTVILNPQSLTPTTPTTPTTGFGVYVATPTTQPIATTGTSTATTTAITSAVTAAAPATAPTAPATAPMAPAAVLPGSATAAAAGMADSTWTLRQPATADAAAAGEGASVAANPPPPPTPPRIVSISLCCTYNTTLRARHDRLLVQPRPPGGAPGPGLRVLTSSPGGPGVAVWCQSLHSVGSEAERGGDTELAAAVRAAMKSLQRELSAANTVAWGRDTAYDAWVARFGPPGEAAARLLRDPGRCLGPLLPYLTLPDSPPLRDLAVANLCGSHGAKAVALAALGARVTVVDASAGNAAYARELAAAAGLADAVSYIVADVAELRTGGLQPPPPPPAAADRGAVPGPVYGEGVQLPQQQREEKSQQPPCLPGPCVGVSVGQYDVVLMEMGVMHYFLDLGALMRDVVAPLLRPGGRLLLREFHPVSTKLITSKGKKHKVTGDYFATQPLVAVDVAYSKYEELAEAGVGAESASAAPDTSASSAGGGRVGGAAGGESGMGGRGGGGGGGRPTAYLRRWGVGEVVSAVCGCGRLAVRLLDEEAGPRLDDAGLPKVFTLLAERVAW